MPKQTPEQLFRAKTQEISELLLQINKRLEVYDHNQRLVYTELQAVRALLQQVVTGQGGQHVVELLKQSAVLADAIGRAWRP